MTNVAMGFVPMLHSVVLCRTGQGSIFQLGHLRKGAYRQWLLLPATIYRVSFRNLSPSRLRPNLCRAIRYISRLTYNFTPNAYTQPDTTRVRHEQLTARHSQTTIMQPSRGVIYDLRTQELIDSLESVVATYSVCVRSCCAPTKWHMSAQTVMQATVVHRLCKP